MCIGVRYIGYLFTKSNLRKEVFEPLRRVFAGNVCGKGYINIIIYNQYFHLISIK